MAMNVCTRTSEFEEAFTLLIAQVVPKLGDSEGLSPYEAYRMRCNLRTPLCRVNTHGYRGGPPTMSIGVAGPQGHDNSL